MRAYYYQCPPNFSVTGSSGAGDLKLGAVGSKPVAHFEVMTAMALLLGIHDAHVVSRASI
jgi:hypothetical protein